MLKFGSVAGTALNRHLMCKRTVGFQQTVTNPRFEDCPKMTVYVYVTVLT